MVARVLPPILRGLHDEHDLFLITSVATGLALAGVGAVVFGVPLALAAFVGGLAVTESREAAEARRRLLPFRDLFAVLFFVAIGTLVDPAGSSRAAAGWAAAGAHRRRQGRRGVRPRRVARLPARPRQLAVGLGQMGEFGFVLASAAVAAGAIDAVLYVEIIAAVAVSIAVSTVVVRYVPPGVQRDPPVADRGPRLPRPAEETPMIRGKLIHPEILAALAGAGHGSKVLITDGNFPHATAPRSRRRGST